MSASCGKPTAPSTGMDMEAEKSGAVIGQSFYIRLYKNCARKLIEPDDTVQTGIISVPPQSGYGHRWFR